MTRRDAALARVEAPPLRLSLAHPAFVLALALLLANDLVLKAAFPGWVTGKLSDVAGLFVLPYFLAWLWPARRRGWHIAVALAFVAWKLPVSRPFVAMWNAAPWFDIARVEDLTDLLALPMVALSWRATARAATRVVHLPGLALAVVSLVAFTATSRPPDRATLTGTYYFDGTAAQFERRLEDAGLGVTPFIEGNAPHRDAETAHWGSWMVSLPFDHDDRCWGLGYDFDVAEAGRSLVIELRGASARCKLEGDNLQLAIREFNGRVAQPAGLRPLRPVPVPAHASTEYACEPVADAPTSASPLPCAHSDPLPAPAPPPVEPPSP
jgi:hypothetical protein